MALVLLYDVRFVRKMAGTHRNFTGIDRNLKYMPSESGAQMMACAGILPDRTGILPEVYRNFGKNRVLWTS